MKQYELVTGKAEHVPKDSPMVPVSFVVRYLIATRMGEDIIVHSVHSDIAPFPDRIAIGSVFRTQDTHDWFICYRDTDDSVRMLEFEKIGITDHAMGGICRDPLMGFLDEVFHSPMDRDTIVSGLRLLLL